MIALKRLVMDITCRAGKEEEVRLRKAYEVRNEANQLME